MHLPEELEIRIQTDPATGAETGRSFPSREAQIKAFNDLRECVRALMEREPEKVIPAPVEKPVEKTDELAPGEWPDGTGASVSNMSEFGYSVTVWDRRFKKIEEAQEWAAQMRKIIIKGK